MNIKMNPKREAKIITTMLLHIGYTHFYKMMLYTNIAKSDKPSYNEAETFTGMFNSIFGTEVSPEQYFKENAEAPDNAIDEYNAMTEIIDALVQNCCMNRKSIESLYKMLFNTFPKRMPCYKVDCCTHYEMYAKNTLLWAYRELSNQQFADSFIRCNPFDGKPRKAKPIEIRNFIRCMIRLYELYKEINLKRIVRELKKQ